MIVPTDLGRITHSADFKIEMVHPQNDEFCWRQTFKKLWASRYAAILATGLVAMGATFIGAAITPYTAPILLSIESPNQVLIEDKGGTTARNRQEEISERVRHATMERDFTLQEEVPATLLGLLGLAIADLLKKQGQRAKK